MRQFLVLGFLLVIQGVSWAQTTASFSISDTVCRNEPIGIANSSIGAVTYSWDFCPGDFEPSPTGSVLITGTPLSRPYQLTIVEEEGNFYGFMGDRSAKALFRFDFGNSLGNTPTMTALSTGLTLSQPTDIQFFHEGGIWYALMADLGNITINRLTFDSGIDDNTPTGVNLGITGMGRPEQIVITQDTSGIKAQVVDLINDRIHYLDFGSSILNTPTKTQFTVTNSENLANLAIMKQGDAYFGLVTSFATDELYWLEYGSTINVTPSITEMTLSGDALIDPFGVQLIQDGGGYYALVASESGSVYRLPLGDTLGGDATVEDLGNLGTSAIKNGLAFYKEGSTWHGFSISRSGQLDRITFNNPCLASQETSTDEMPIVSYDGAGGNYQLVALMVQDVDGNTDVVIDSLFVENSGPADITLSVDSMACLSNTIDFSATVNAGTFTDYTWDFGDSNTSTGTEVTHAYGTAGQYFISLTGILADGCSIPFYDTISVYEDPVVAFTLPSDNLCTNTLLAFENTTTGGADSVTEWSWNYNDEGSGSEAEGAFTFTSSGSKDITLIATLPGCADTLTQSLSLQDGPSAGFSFTNNCFGDSVQFMNTSSATDTESIWYFGDGDSLVSYDATYRYTAAGNYPVTLSVNDTLSGCITEFVDTVRVNDQPLAEYTAPSSLVQYETYSLTGADLSLEGDSVTAWYWELDGDSIGNQQAIAYQFLQSGTLTLDLIVQTAQGCTDTISQAQALTAASVPFAQFSLPDTVCQDEVIALTNTSLGATTFAWDFCPGDFEVNPSGEVITDASPLNRPYQLTLVEDGGNYYGFMGDRSARAIFRFDFGNSLANTPTITTLSTGLPLSQPTDIQFFQESGAWYAILVDLGTPAIYRLTFDSGLHDDTPTGENLTITGLSRPEQATIVQDTSGIKVQIVDLNNDRIHHLDFGSSILNTPTKTQFTVTNSENLANLAIMKQGDTYFGLASSFATDELYWLEYGSTINATPSISMMTLSGDALVNPFGIALIQDAAQYYALVTGELGALYHLPLGDTLGGPAVVENLGDLGTANAKHGLSFLKVRSTWYGFSVSDSGQLDRVSFKNHCEVSDETSVGPSPRVSYYQMGTQKITLSATGVDGTTSTYLDSIFIRPIGEYSLELTVDNLMCQSTFITGLAVDTIGNFESFYWDLGDGNSLEGDSITYQYDLSGTYPIAFRGTLSNGCTVTQIDSTLIVPPPVASFQLPTDIPCTIDTLQFDNTSTGGADGITRWSWDFGNSIRSSAFTGQVAYTEEGTYAISLAAEVPGCADTTTQDLVLLPSPRASFILTDPCEEKVQKFSHAVPNNMAEIRWDFGDGFTSNNTQPLHDFATPGDYLVSMVIVDSNGCSDIYQETIAVHSQPQAKFTTEPICEGIPTQFYDESTVENSNLIMWEWSRFDHGDTMLSSMQSPALVFEQASGTVALQLKVTSNYGCVDSTQGEVEVFATPDLEILTSSVCQSDIITLTPKLRSNSGDAIMQQTWNVNGEIFTTEEVRKVFDTQSNLEVTLSASLSNGCLIEISDEISLQRPESPLVLIDTACVNSPVPLTISNPQTGYHYQWLFEGGQTAMGTSRVLHSVHPGDFTFHIITTDPDGCQDTLAASVPIRSGPVAQFSTSVDEGGVPLSLSVENQSQGASEYQWIVSGPENYSTTEVQPTFELQEIGKHVITLVATNSYHCFDTTFITVNTLLPILEFSIDGLFLTETSTGGSNAIASVSNLGNIPIDSLLVSWNINNEQLFKMVLHSGLSPESQRNITIPMGWNPNRDATQTVCFAFSPIISNEFQVEEQNLLDNNECLLLNEQFQVPAVYPNPVIDELNIPVVVSEVGDITLTFQNSRGLILSEETHAAKSGYNLFSFSTNHLPSGLYVVTISNQNRQERRVWVKY